MAVDRRGAGEVAVYRPAEASCRLQAISSGILPFVKFLRLRDPVLDVGSSCQLPQFHAYFLRLSSG